jgi:hypothetical protein
MTAEQLFPMLQSMQASLKLADYQYIEAHGLYRTIKRWARQKCGELVSGDEGLPDNLSMVGQQQVGQAQQETLMVVAGPGQAPMAQGATVAQQMGMQPGMPQQGLPQVQQYHGPAGFVNAPMQQAGGAAPVAMIGPDGKPME